MESLPKISNEVVPAPRSGKELRSGRIPNPGYINQAIASNCGLTDGRPAAALATGTKPILSNGRMGGINLIPIVLCVHNNKEPRSKQSSSKSGITRKNSPW
ncbi:hypothetical protein PIB30_090795 [Stylosanthes scabra]|uniref:Uncharacterized protein n=1 Tax=Stylosanthes scabra TaxID=79078 RepID=A0ABU6ZT08_9FABA|nr:hypothetical protein [Stylosanthes scabra]